jgi:hypothetical protein
MALKEMSLVDFVVGSLEKGESGTDGDMTYRKFDLLKWKSNYGSVLEDVEVLTNFLR